MNSKTHDLSRRRFVGACCASVGTTGLLSSLAQLRLMGAAASPDAPATPPRAGAPAPDFKALVCLFFAGGNDANNLVVPADNAGYAAYASARGALALTHRKTRLQHRNRYRISPTTLGMGKR